MLFRSMQNSVSAIAAASSAPPKRVGKSSAGATKVSAISELIKITVKIAFINYVYEFKAVNYSIFCPSVLRQARLK